MGEKRTWRTSTRKRAEKIGKRERVRERWEEWMKACELPKLKRLFIDFPALNSNEERLPKQKQQNEMIKKKKNSVQGTSRVGQSEAAAIVNIQIRVPTWLRVRTGTLERHKYPYPCPDSDPDQALPLPLPLYPAPQALEDVCTTQLPFRWLVRKIYKLRAMRYKIQYGVGEKKEVTTAAIEPRPLQQRVESVLKETNTNEIKNERQVGESMEHSTSSMTGSKHRMWMRWGGECGLLHCRCSLTSEMYNEESNWQSNCANTLSW